MKEREKRKSEATSANNCDYLHPEECDSEKKDNLEQTEKAVQEKVDEFLDDENASKES